jgi:hypothetical protein
MMSNIEEFYLGPTQEDYHTQNIKTRLLEVDILKRFNSFGDRELLQTTRKPTYEPFTVVSVMPSELYFVDRNVFMQLIPKNFKPEFKNFPNDFKIRKKFYEQK